MLPFTHVLFFDIILAIRPKQLSLGHLAFTGCPETSLHPNMLSYIDAVSVEHLKTD